MVDIQLSNYFDDDEDQLLGIEKQITKNWSLLENFREKVQEEDYRERQRERDRAKDVGFSLRLKNKNINKLRIRNKQQSLQKSDQNKIPNIDQKKQKQQTSKPGWDRVRSVIQQARKQNQVDKQDQSGQMWRMRQMKYHGKSIFDKIDSIRTKGNKNQ